MRIAILGGSFDPIHLGHLQIAKYALKQKTIDEVWFMPTQATPLKDHQLTSFAHRVKMIRLTISPFRHMRVCTLEGELVGQSYTIRTVKELKKRYPQHQFCWLIGDDQAASFDAWKDSEQLKKEIDFYVFSRGEEHVVSHGFQRIAMPLIDISSTQIREGKKRWLLASAVRRYIGANGLYLKTYVSSCMSEKRYLHSESVAKLCVRLGEAHGLDGDVCYQMGMVHDICKQIPYETACIWMRYHLGEKMCEQPSIWHGYIGAYEVKHRLKIDDSRIYHAVWNHVKGDCKNDYDRVLYIADKLDPLRGYDITKQLAVSIKDLTRGYQMVKEEQQTYLVKTGVL